MAAQPRAGTLTSSSRIPYAAARPPLASNRPATCRGSPVPLRAPARGVTAVCRADKVGSNPPLEIHSAELDAEVVATPAVSPYVEPIADPETVDDDVLALFRHSSAANGNFVPSVRYALATLPLGRFKTADAKK